MEKLAVDLEKLLDDFEFHEEQRIDYASKQPPINNTYVYNYSDYPRNFTPASNYRRPPFEPINLSEANFTVTTSPQNQSQYSFDDCSESSASFTAYESVSQDDTLAKAPSEPPLVYAFKSREFKPDLIESNSDICSSLSEFDRFERHLPDIASTDVEIKDEKANFDLITNNVDCKIDNSAISFTKPAEVIRFPTTTNISESELHQYLEELEKHELEKAADVSVNKISIQVPPKIEDNEYKEKTEIEIDNCDGSVLHEDVTSNERTSLNLNAHTGDVTTVEITEKSDSDDNETESSLLETITSTEETFVTNNGVEDKTSTEELNTQSEVEITDNSSLQESVASDESGYAANENEEPNAIDNVKHVSETLETPYPYKRIVEENQVNLEVDSRFESACSPTEYNEAEKVLIEDEAHSDEIDIDAQAKIAQKSSTACMSDEQSHESRNAKENYERPSTSKVEDEEAVQNETNSNTISSKLQRPDSLDLTHTTQNSEISSTSADSGSLLSVEERKLGKEPPVWILDSESSVCMHCQTKFTMMRRRHHCRACGFLLCSKCCDLKANLEYLRFEEARVCRSCHSIIERVNNLEAEISSLKRPNPNNPMEYCSTIPPLLQVGPTQPAPPSVLVPVVGVLKREGRSRNSDTPKQVIFSDGIRPGGDLTELDAPSEPRLPLRRSSRITRRVPGTPPGNVVHHRRMLNAETQSFIPTNQDLPPLVVKKQGDCVYSEMEKPLTAEDEAVKFAINRNLFVMVKRIILDCCVNRDVWCMTTEGLSCVGQDEVVFILEVLPDEKYPPKDVFWMVNMLYQEASKGSTVTEMSFATFYMNQLFDSKDHAGFVFIRPTYQCVQKLLLPKAPFLIALLIHRWEAPWARLFPIRLVLRLGAEFRYYPCPLVSVRNRSALFTDIGNTIIGLLADFRKYSYSLPTVRGLMIHMEDRLTTILLPRNRYDQVKRAMDNSEENVLAFAGNISTIADSHLVCIQSAQDDISYHTQAINIHNKPRQVTGASFIVFNGSLKQCSWAGKSNIVEDGLMVQIPSESMANLRSALRQMNDYSIGCGPHAEERVVLKWAADDVSFNIGVKSNIDNRPLDGVPSIRVHNGTDYSGASRLIRWTEVFILQSDEDSGSKTGDTVNISKLSESIARATCIALVPLLDLLATANLTTLAVRATIHPENVGYEAGSMGEKLRPLYMKRLDNELIAVVHKAAVSIRDISCPIVLELIFKIMEQG